MPLAAKNQVKECPIIAATGTTAGVAIAGYEGGTNAISCAAGYTLYSDATTVAPGGDMATCTGGSYAMGTYNCKQS